jgi:hypothetical protein
MNEAHEYYTQLAGLQELIAKRRPSQGWSGNLVN